ncbi:hypothetical protein PILCRDRAFT_820830 [Piloderma croceum F 1598]|uniref:Ketoreductase (KR) domain-containing protein n=1 Tax=Piloderma croceum (strain F 1598) TaxID=765440 RepID=A0A0C3FS30_PILCF|nr:hypothetical protein PILCRDRAFT_820830 [Piloderma croceum F 1598]
MGRSQIKGQAAVEMIRAVTGADEEQVEFLQFDLADIKNTKSAAEKFPETSQPLHILVNNAGLLRLEFELTPRDKLESHVASSCAPGSFPHPTSRSGCTDRDAIIFRSHRCQKSGQL